MKDMKDMEAQVQHIRERERRLRPLIEAPLTKEIMEDYDFFVLNLENIEGDYIKDYGKKEPEISLENSQWARDSVLTSGEPLPDIDPRTGAYGQDISSMGFLNAGMAFMNKGDFAEAIANFDKAKAVELNPRNTAALYFKGIARVKIGEWKQAAYEDMQDAIDLHPIRLAEKSEHNRKFVETLDIGFREEMMKTLACFLHARGGLFKEHKYYDDAIQDFTDAIKYDPDSTDSYVSRAVIYVIIEQHEDAIIDCTEAIRQNPNQDYTYEVRGLAYAHLERYKEAVEDFNKMLSMGPSPSGHCSSGFSYAFIYTSRSHCYHALGDFPKALEDMNMALQLEPDKPDYYSRRACIYRNMEEYDKAIADYKEMIRLDNPVNQIFGGDSWRERAEYWIGEIDKKRKGLPVDEHFFN